MKKKTRKKLFLCVFLLVLTFAVLMSSCDKEAKSDVIIENQEDQTDIENTQTYSTADSEESVPQYQALPSGELSDKATGDIVEIDEDMFMLWLMEISSNSDHYIGKTIRLQGLYDIYEDPADGSTYPIVYRYGSAGGSCGGCSDDLGRFGFEFIWDQELPQKDDWIEVTGEMVRMVSSNGYEYYALDAISVEIKEEERGLEEVGSW